MPELKRADVARRLGLDPAVASKTEIAREIDRLAANAKRREERAFEDLDPTGILKTRQRPPAPSPPTPVTITDDMSDPDRAFAEREQAEQLADEFSRYMGVEPRRRTYEEGDETSEDRMYRELLATGIVKRASDD